MNEGPLHRIYWSGKVETREEPGKKEGSQLSKEKHKIKKYMALMEKHN